MAAPDEAVERADQGDVQAGGLLEDGLHLVAVLADDVGVVPAGLVEEVTHEVDLVVEEVAVQGAEGAEGVGGEEDLVRHIVGHDDLGPVDHLGRHEGQRMMAGLQGVALLDRGGPGVHVKGEELLQHGLGQTAADDLHVGIAQDDVLDAGGVVRLQVLHDQVVQLAAVQHGGDVFEEVVTDGAVDGVEEDGLVIQQQIGIIRDAVADAVDALEHGQTAVIGADPGQVFGYVSHTMHRGSSCYLIGIK